MGNNNSGKIEGGNGKNVIVTGGGNLGQINGGGEDDVIVVANNNSGVVEGNNGNDKITVGSNNAGIISGDNGDDIITLANNNSGIVGGDNGDDKIIIADNNSGKIEGGNADDNITIGCNNTGEVDGGSGNNVIFIKENCSLVSGYKFKDLNNNNQWDQGEPGISAWTINLYKKEGGLISSTVTNEDGYYEFRELKDDTYLVCEKPKDGWRQSYPSVQDGSTDCNSEKTRGWQILIEKSINVNQRNFGNLKEGEGKETGTIKGKKFNDINGDGSVMGDPILSNWIIRLYKSSSSPWALIDSKVTNEKGEYEFKVTSEVYKVCEVLKGGWIETFASSPTTNNSPNKSEEGPFCQTVNIDTSDEVNTKNFGNFFGKISEKGSIIIHKFTFGGDRIFGIDLNLNGSIFDHADVKSEDGYVSNIFLNLPAGNYTVKETLVAGWKEVYNDCNITLLNGTSKDCTIVNIKNGKILIGKETMGGTDGPFDFSIKVGNNLPASLKITTQSSNDPHFPADSFFDVFFDINSGLIVNRQHPSDPIERPNQIPVEIVELQLLGWMFRNPPVQCLDTTTENPVSFTNLTHNLGQNGLNVKFSINPGQQLKCLFTNEIQGGGGGGGSGGGRGGWGGSGEGSDGGGSSGAFVSGQARPTLTIIDSSIKILNITKTEVTISWETDFPSSGYIIYSKESEAKPMDFLDKSGNPPKYGYTNTTNEIDIDPKTALHTVTITGLEANNTYYFRLISREPFAFGNEYKFTTAAILGQQAVSSTPPVKAPETQEQKTSSIAPKGEQSPSSGVEETTAKEETEEKTADQLAALVEAGTIGSTWDWIRSNAILWIILLILLVLISIYYYYKNWRQNQISN